MTSQSLQSLTNDRKKTSMKSETRVFLGSLFSGKPDDLYILLWTFHEKRSHWFRNVPDAIRWAEAHHQMDLYVGIGLARHDYGSARRCPSEEIVGIVGICADLDLRSAAHPKTTLPSTIEEALAILPTELPPTFIVLTGNGIQVWWLFREPNIFDTDEERRAAATLVNRWHTLLRDNASQHGWTYERLADLARVLRVPGTTNCKDPSNLKPVSIHSQTGRHYNPSDFEECLEGQGIPKAEEQERTSRAWKEESADKPLSINPNATVPDDRLNQYLADSRFKKTWLRQREDLKDQSQSGYDLALANFGLDARLSEQQVIDLMIHHRRIHGKQQRTRLDYFQRTISKASKRNDNLAPVRSFEGPGGEAGGPSPQTKPDSPTARVLLCEQISNVIGVRVLRIVKIDGQEPTYRLELEATKIGFPSVDKLVGQQSFRMKIASAVDHLVPRIAPKVWDRVAQMILNALTVEDGGDEANLVGAARLYVERYLAETPYIDAEEDHPYQTRFKPTVYEGQVAICSHDLKQHINKAWGENRAIKEVTAMLSALGASSSRLKRTRLRDQSRWLLPSNEFAPDAQVGAREETSDGRPS